MLKVYNIFASWAELNFEVQFYGSLVWSPFSRRFRVVFDFVLCTAILKSFSLNINFFVLFYWGEAVRLLKRKRRRSIQWLIGFLLVNKNQRQPCPFDLFQSCSIMGLQMAKSTLKQEDVPNHVTFQIFRVTGRNSVSQKLYFARDFSKLKKYLNFVDLSICTSVKFSEFMKFWK